MSHPESTVHSPCVRNCCLNDDSDCLGCFRSIEEIQEWALADDPRRRVILDNAQRRRDAYESQGRAISRESPSRA